MTDGSGRLVVDIMDGDFYAADPYSAWEWMRRNEPVYHDEKNDVWGVTRYADVRACSVNPAAYCNGQGQRPHQAFVMPMMIQMDPPDHTRRRKLVSAGFTPRRIAEMRDHVVEVCDEILDQVTELGGCDFVFDVAAPLPLIMIAEMLGVAEDARDNLLHWSDAMVKSEGASDPALLEGAMNAFIEYSAYITEVIEDRRSTGRTDDIIGILTNAEIDGERLSNEDLIYETLLILVGGDETTRHVLSGGMLALQQHPDQLAALKADLSGLTRASEEMLRWVSPVKNMARTTTREITLGETVLPQGAQLMLFYPSANRDEDIFADSTTFDITRHPNPHLAFGLGTHFCLGNQLARIELAAMFERVFARMPDLRLVPGTPLPLRPSNFVSGLEEMRVEFTPSPRLR